MDVFLRNAIDANRNLIKWIQRKINGNHRFNRNKNCFENCHRSIFQSSLIRNLKCILNCLCAVCHKAIIWMPTISPTFVELLSTWFRDDCNQNSRSTQVYTTIYARSSTTRKKTSSTRIKIINDCVADCWYCFIEWI